MKKSDEDWIVCSVRLKVMDRYLYLALKESLRTARPRRMLDILYHYARDPRVQYSIEVKARESGSAHVTY